MGNKELIEPFNQQVIIEQDIEGETTEAGLHLSESARAKFRSGVILSKAEDCKVPIKVGDRVGWQKFAGSGLVIRDGDNKELKVIVMHEQSITMRVAPGIRLDGGSE